MSTKRTARKRLFFLDAGKTGDTDAHAWRWPTSAAPPNRGHSLWGRAIRELQDGRPERILEAIDTLPIPTFAQKVLKTLATPQREGGRPPKRFVLDELDLTEEFLGEWLQLLQDGEPDSKATAIENVLERHPEISEGALRGIVEKHRAQYAWIMKSIGKLLIRPHQKLAKVPERRKRPAE